MIRELTLFCALAASAAAQAPAEPQPVVTGRTVTEDGQPLRKVILTLLPIGTGDSGEPLPPYTITSDTAGRFEFYSVPPGRYRLVAERAGYLKTYYGARNTWAEGSVLTLRASQPITGLAVRMTEQSVISGSVVLGEGANTVLVYLLQERYQDGRRQWVRLTSAVNQSGGDFSFNKLAPGRYRLAAEARGIAAVAPGQSQRSALTYYPGVVDAGSAETIEVRRGQAVSDLRLPLLKSALFSVSGTITGKPPDAGRMVVYLASAGVGVSGSAAVTGDKFRIESVPLGSYALGVMDMSGSVVALAGGGVMLASGSAMRLASMQPVQVSGDVDGLTLGLDPGAGIRGAVAGAPAGTKLRVLLSPVDIPMPYNAQAEVNADGTFAIPGSFAGRFRLQIEGLPADAYIKSAMYGKKDALDPLDLARTVGDEKLEIVLGAPAARISGVVRDEKGKALEGTVTLIPDPPQPQRTSLYQLAETGGNGSFQFQGIRPGKYRLYAWEEFEPGAQFDPDVTGPFEARSVAIEVAEGGRKEVTVTRISVDEAEAARKPR
ncbi:MAG: carboxypeptidase-like regulatory domain-containing protein [Bryobacteraceae bacterium]|jgi:hypothetical protein